MPVGNPVFPARSRYALFLCLNFSNDFGGKTVAFLPPGPTSSGGKTHSEFPPFFTIGNCPAAGGTRLRRVLIRRSGGITCMPGKSRRGASCRKPHGIACRAAAVKRFGIFFRFPRRADEVATLDRLHDDHGFSELAADLQVFAGLHGRVLVIDAAPFQLIFIERADIRLSRWRQGCYTHCNINRHFCKSPQGNFQIHQSGVSSPNVTTRPALSSGMIRMFR